MAGLLPVDDALALLLADARPLECENVAISGADGRVLAEPVSALRTQPPFDASAMDGYAVRAADIASVPATLSVIGEAAAGSRFAGTVGQGEAVRIFTGAPLPEGADTVLLQEDTRPAEPGAIEATEATARGRHVRKAGLDFHEGEPLLPAGRRLDPFALSLAAAANYAILSVVRRPRVAILATGSELVAPGQPAGPDQIVASNGYGIAAMARSAGAEVHDLGIVPDDPEAMASRIEEALRSQVDIIVTLGGASVGDHDLVRPVLEGMGMRLDFWKIAMRPGKPLMFGRLNGARVLGLPGNPVSSLVCALVFLRPLVERLAGGPGLQNLQTAVLGSAMNANDHRQDYVRARATRVDDHLVATPFERQDSSMLRTMAEADVLIVRAPNAPAAAPGDPCSVLRLR